MEELDDNVTESGILEACLVLPCIGAKPCCAMLCCCLRVLGRYDVLFVLYHDVM